MAKLTGLGRGLDALLQSAPLNTNSLAQNVVTSKIPPQVNCDDKGTLWLDPHLLVANPNQPRKSFDKTALEELSNSIKAHGVLEPILCEYKDGQFVIVAGERRARAALMAAVARVPISLREYDEGKRLEVALIENIQRTDLNPIEEAKAYQNILDISGGTQEDVARKVGKSRSTVTNILRLLKLPEGVQDAIVGGAISRGHAKVLLSIEDEEQLKRVAEEVVEKRLSVSDTQKLATKANKGTLETENGKDEGDIEKAKVKGGVEVTNEEAEFLSLEQKFINKLGTKVKISGTVQRGSLVIEYFGKEDLDRLVLLIIGNQTEV